MVELKKNQIYTVNIEGYTSDAMGVCHVEGRAVFVPGTLIGESWEIKLLKVSSSAIYGKAMRLITPSPERMEPMCPHFGKCGGCDTLHMRYSEELDFKLSKVNAALKHIGKQTVAADEIIASDSVSRYRNKGIFAVSGPVGEAEFGFYRQRSHELIPIKDCLIQSELSCRAADAVAEFINLHKLPAYNEENGKGIVRHVFCRQAVHDNGAVACIVAARGFGGLTDKLTEHLKERCPELTGIVLNINKSRGNTVLTGEFYTLWGSPNISDSLCGLRYEIAPQAFFQINPHQAEKLYKRAIEYAAVGKEDLAFDLYCGAGTISLYLAQSAGHVIAAEIVPEAIENARKNALNNNIDNVEFICADAGEAAQNLAERGLKPKVVVVDPPRKGMDENAVKAIASMAPDRVVYVSCNPATLARDILRLEKQGFMLKKASAVDMFPRTCHVEAVAVLYKV